MFPFFPATCRLTYIFSKFLNCTFLRQKLFGQKVHKPYLMQKVFLCCYYLTKVCPYVNSCLSIKTSCLLTEFKYLKTISANLQFYNFKKSIPKKSKMLLLHFYRLQRKISKQLKSQS